MHLRMTAGVLGAFLAFLGMIMLTPAFFAWYYGEWETLQTIIWTGLGTMVVGGALWLSFSPPKREITTRQGLMIVGGAWLLSSFFGALPYYFGPAGHFTSFTDCFFESASGFTTTGATILTEIETVPKGLLFWRSLTHWLGGMGIIVLSVALLPLIGVGGMQLFRAEVPGPVADKIKPRIVETARTLWIIYFFLTMAETVMLMLGGLDFHAALCHSFATMATGGFSTRDVSIESYNSSYLHVVITVFMFLAGVNFALHFAALRSGVKGYWRDTEFRVYLAIVCSTILVVTVVLSSSSFGHVTDPATQAAMVERYDSMGTALRDGAFQVNTIISTTGFTTCDYELWPFGLQVLLLLLMFMGGCTGSTGGGMKVMRWWLMIKHAYNELYLLIHPRAVKPLIYGRSVVAPGVMRSIWSFSLLFAVLLFAGSFAMAMLGLDPLSAISSVVACLGNIGPALGSVGPHDNFAHIPVAGKWILALCMLLGRLEIYTIIILFVPEYWRK